MAQLRRFRSHFNGLIDQWRHTQRSLIFIVNSTLGLLVSRREGSVRFDFHRLAFWDNGDARVEAPEHLRICDMEAAARERAVAPPPPPSPVIAYGRATKPAPRRFDRAPALQRQYDESVRRMESNIYTIAAAVSALDGIEKRLAEARTQIGAAMAHGEPLDHSKVHRMVSQLVEHLNGVVAGLDQQCVNLLRDSRIEIKLVELDDDLRRETGLTLTLISLEKLMAHKLKNGGRRSEDLAELIDDISTIVRNNVHILSSMILVLFSAREYVDGVTGLVLPESAAEHVAITNERPVAAALTAVERRAISEGWAMQGDERIAEPHRTAMDHAPAMQFAMDRRPAPSLVAMLDEIG